MYSKPSLKPFLKRINDTFNEYYWRGRILKHLSPQERKVLIAMSRQNKPLRLKEVANVSRIWQYNHMASILGRMVKKGFIEKLFDKTYQVKGEDLRQFLIQRYGVINHA